MSDTPHDKRQPLRLTRIFQGRYRPIACFKKSLLEASMVHRQWRGGLIWLLLAMGLVGLMPSDESLWIDEGYSVPYASPQSFTRFVDRITHDTGSESLMPLGMFSIWVGSKVLDRSERGLRIVSSFWVAVAVFLMWLVGLRVGMPWMTLVFACHPFVWYYGGEARPYAMVIAMGAGVLLGVVAVVCSDGRGFDGLIPLLTFGTILCATHLLGVVPFLLSVTVFFCLVRKNTWQWSRSQWIAASISALSLCAVGSYYLWALARGAETAWKGPWSFEIASIIFSGYELLGFVGFGPGRYELRQLAIEGGLKGAATSLIQLSSIGALILLAIYGYVLSGVLSRSRTRGLIVDRVCIATGCVLVLTVLAALVGSFITDTPFWGRHLAAIFPFLILIVVLAAGSVGKSGTRTGKRVTVFLCVALLASSLMVRFNPRHSRDDYRSAAQLAVTAAADGQTVWWAAAPETAAYYGVTFCARGEPDQSGCIVYFANDKAATLKTLAKPEIIILSKPDLFDTSSTLQHYIDSRGFDLHEEFMAFKVFRPREGR